MTSRWPTAARAVSLLLFTVLAGCDQPLESVVLRVNHRMYPAFQETHRAAPGEPFAIGDTDYSARIVGFVPDFAIATGTKEVVSRSNELRNPAVRLEVYQNNKKVDEVWAFRGEGPPHFGAESMLAFRIEELVWKPGQAPPAPAADSTASSGPESTASPPDSSGGRPSEKP